MEHEAHKFHIPSQNQLERVDDFLDGQIEDLRSDVIREAGGTQTPERHDEARLAAEVLDYGRKLQARTNFAEAA